MKNRIGIFLLAAFVAGSAVGGTARAAESSKGDGSKKDEYSFQWLDPDKKIYVLQNRRYPKADRGMVSLLAGPGFSSSYRDTGGISGRAAYYFSEVWGLEFAYTRGLSSENDTFRALSVSAPTALPVVREIRSQMGLNLMFVPWYAKINMFNSILYFDWYFSVGGGQLASALDTRRSATSGPSFEEKNLAALFLGTGHIFHLSDSFLARLDFSTAIYKDSLKRDGSDEGYYSNSLFGIGLGLKL